MKTIVDISNNTVMVGAKIYIEAYSKEPWNENREIDSVCSYIKRFLLGNMNFGWLLYEDNIAIGIILGSIIPAIDGDYFRIEDLCISPDKQNLGNGSEFLKLTSEKLLTYDIDSILLNTVKGFPSCKFYLKNDFNEISSSALFCLELNNENY